jgi:hypothetical protein
MTHVPGQLEDFTNLTTLAKRTESEAVSSAASSCDLEDEVF